MAVDEAPRCTYRLVAVLMAGMVLLCVMCDRLRYTPPRYDDFFGTPEQTCRDLKVADGQHYECRTYVVGAHMPSTSSRCNKKRRAWLVEYYLVVRDASPPFGSTVGLVTPEALNAALDGTDAPTDRWRWNSPFSYAMNGLLARTSNVKTILTGHILDLRRDLTGPPGARLSWNGTVQAYLSNQSSLETMLPNFTETIAAIVDQRRHTTPRGYDSAACDVLNVVLHIHMGHSLDEVVHTSVKGAPALVAGLSDARRAVQVRLVQLLSAEPDKYGNHMNEVRFQSRLLPLPFLGPPLALLDGMTEQEKLAFAARTGLVLPDGERATTDEYVQTLCPRIEDSAGRERCAESCAAVNASIATIRWLSARRYEQSGRNHRYHRFVDSDDDSWRSVSDYQVELAAAPDRLIDCLHWSPSTVRNIMFAN